MKGLLIDVGPLPNCILVVGRKLVVGKTNFMNCTDVFTKHRERFRILRSSAAAFMWLDRIWRRWGTGGFPTRLCTTHNF